MALYVHTRGDREKRGEGFNDSLSCNITDKRNLSSKSQLDVITLFCLILKDDSEQSI